MDIMLASALVLLIVGCVAVTAFERRPPVIDPQSHDGADLFERHIALDRN
jgi:hypothetical protein